MPSRRRATRGFTLIELVAVTACVSTVMALAFPALQRTRQDARSVQCRNNLKQLGLALHNYHDAYATFPPGWVVKETEAKAGPAFAWSAQLLPYLDEAYLYQELQINHPPSLAPPRLYTSDLQVFRCPVDESPRTLKDRGGFGTSNYPGNYGVELIPENDEAEATSGLFFRNSSVRLIDIRDGTSNTFMAGERGAKTGAAIWSIVRSNAKAEDAVASSNHEKKMNVAEEAFSSGHEGGAYFLFGDGAVKFISEKISSSDQIEPVKGTFQLLSHRDDGRAINPAELPE